MSVEKPEVTQIIVHRKSAFGIHFVYTKTVFIYIGVYTYGLVLL